MKKRLILLSMQLWCGVVGAVCARTRDTVRWPHAAHGTLWLSVTLTPVMTSMLPLLCRSLLASPRELFVPSPLTALPLCWPRYLFTDCRVVFYSFVLRQSSLKMNRWRRNAGKWMPINDLRLAPFFVHWLMLKRYQFAFLFSLLFLEMFKTVFFFFFAQCKDCRFGWSSAQGPRSRTSCSAGISGRRGIRRWWWQRRRACK